MREERGERREECATVDLRICAVGFHPSLGECLPHEVNPIHLHVSYSLNSLKGGVILTTIGEIKGGYQKFRLWLMYPQISPLK